MRPKKNVFIVAVMLIIIAASSAYAAKQIDTSFDVPPPPNTRLLDTQELDWVVGEQMYITTYESAEAASAVIFYYRNFFAQQRFQKISDTANEKIKRHTLRFKKDQLIVDVMVIDRQVKREIAISKFLQAEEETSPELAGRLTAKSLISFMPDEDEPGKDLTTVPRPPQSVRMMVRDNGDGLTIMYRTSLNAKATADFYRLKMPAYQWKLVNETATAKAVEAYKQATGEKSLGIKSPFPDGENLEQVVSDSYMLKFSSGSDSAQITVMPNFLSRKLGSMVQIVYSEKQK